MRENEHDTRHFQVQAACGLQPWLALHVKSCTLGFSVQDSGVRCLVAHNVKLQLHLQALSW